MITFYILVFVFGTIIGSFLNVVILRMNTGRGLGGRSACFCCNKKLTWYELIPIVSYLFLLGKCSRCKSNVSIQYPLVEAGTGILFALIAYVLSPLWAIIYAIIACLTVVIFVYDLKHCIIPDALVFMFITAGLILRIAEYTISHSTPDLLAGPLFALFFASLWYFSGGTWMGFGDSKLVLGIGLILGMSFGLAAVMIGFWLGSIVGVLLIIVSRFIERKAKKRIHMKTEIPFAPFLIIGFWVALLFNVNMAVISNLFVL